MTLGAEVRDLRDPDRPLHDDPPSVPRGSGGGRCSSLLYAFGLAVWCPLGRGSPSKPTSRLVRSDTNLERAPMLRSSGKVHGVAGRCTNWGQICHAAEWLVGPILVSTQWGQSPETGLATTSVVMRSIQRHAIRSSSRWSGPAVGSSSGEGEERSMAALSRPHRRAHDPTMT